MLFSLNKEINRLISKGMSNIYYWEKLTFSKCRFSWKEKLKKCNSFEQQKVTRYIWGNIYLDIIVFCCPWSTKPCFRFPITCFVWETKGFYQSSLGNEIDFTDVINISPNILVKIKIKKNWDTVLYMKEQWLQQHECLPVTRKPMYLFLCKKKPENAFLTLTVNYRKIVQKTKNKKIMPLKTTVNWLFNDIISHWLFWLKNCRFSTNNCKGLLYP